MADQADMETQQTASSQSAAELKRAEEALRGAEDRLRLVLEAAQIGAFDWNLETNHLISSGRYEELWGFEPGEAAHSDEALLERVLMEDRAGIVEELQRCIRERTYFLREFRVLWPDRSQHWLMMRGEFSFNEKGQPLQLRGVVMDVTDRKLHEESLHEARQKAEESSRTKSDFLANMSHEIRTPLNAIVGMTYLALRSSPNPRQERYLRKIGNAAETLLGVTNDILDFSKIEAGKLDIEHIPFLLDDVLHNLNDIVSQKAEQKGIKIVFSIARGETHYLMGDPLRLGQVLINLLNNSVKFTDRGGEVSVKVTVPETNETGGWFRFTVSDTGIGMSPDQVSRLFQSFTQADSSVTRKYGGTGLGLAISKQLAELMGGALAVQSELGRGSTFIFSVPFQFATGPIPLPSKAEISDLRKSVLVIDQDEDSRVRLISILYKNGFVARSAASGWEALTLLATATQAGKPYDLVVMDWRFPGAHGIENSRRIKEHLTHAKVPAILMISDSEREEVTGGLADPSMDAFLLKPIKEDQLIDAIASIFGVKPTGLLSELRMMPEKAPDTLIGRRVLVVEDNRINRELATELLEDLGLRVSYAENGEESVEMVMREPFDLVLMDVQMPVTDGLTATRRIREQERFRSLPIIAMTAHAMSSDRDASLQAGMNDHMTKPISPNKLRETLVRWMPPTPAAPAAAAKPVLRMPDPPAWAMPKELPPFNLPAALARANGKEALLRKLMIGFRDTYAEAIPKLRLMLEDDKREDALLLTHSLKGIAATLEAQELAKAALALELALREGLTGCQYALLLTLEQELAPAIEAVSLLDSPRARLLSSM